MQSRAVMMDGSDLLRRYQTLLEVGEVIHAFRDIDDLFHNLAELLRRVILCDGIAVGLLDESKESITLLRGALDSVALPRRAVLIMHDLDGVPMTEIAKKLSISRFGAYARLRKARRELATAVRRLLNEGGPR